MEDRDEDNFPEEDDLLMLLEEEDELLDDLDEAKFFTDASKGEVSRSAFGEV